MIKVREVKDILTINLLVHLHLYRKLEIGWNESHPGGKHKWEHEWMKVRGSVWEHLQNSRESRTLTQIVQEHTSGKVELLFCKCKQAQKTWGKIILRLVK